MTATTVPFASMNLPVPPVPAFELLAALHSAEGEVDRLTQLSEDLLVIAASEQGRSEPARTDVDVGPQFRALAVRFSARAQQEDRRITVASEEGPVARANAGRLERALSNLVDNALRHGAGDVELGAEARDGHVSIWVIDHGHGMDDAFRARAHEPYRSRVDRPVTGRSRARPGHRASHRLRAPRHYDHREPRRRQRHDRHHHDPRPARTVTSRRHLPLPAR